MTAKASKIKSNYTFFDIYNIWLEGYKLGVRESTLLNTMSLFKNHILLKIGDYNLNMIDFCVAQEVVNLWSNELKNYKCLKVYVQKVYSYAIRLGVVEDDPFRYVTMPPSKRQRNTVRSRDNFFTKEELERFLGFVQDELSLKWFAFFRLLAYGGIRRGEALALTWDDIDFSTQSVIINKTLSRNKEKELCVNSAKTEAGERTIYLDSETLEVLKRWKIEQVEKKEGSDSLNIVFGNKSASYISLSTPIKYLNSICEKHGLKRITLHGLRHTHCSLLFESGASIKAVQDRLGHRDIKTTMDIYAHVTDRQKKQAIDRLVAYMNEEE